MPAAHAPACPLFVYGTLLTGEPAHRLVQPYVIAAAPAQLLGAALYSLGRYPVAVIGRGRVIGELLWLHTGAYDAALRRLDEYEGAKYIRATRIVQDLARNVAVNAWVYLGQQRPPPIYPRIKGGDWRTHRRRSDR